MKIYIALLLTLCILIFSACSLPAETSEPAVTSPTADTTQPATTSESTTEPEPVIPQVPLVTVSLPTITESATAEDGTVLFNYTYQNISLITPDADVADLVIIDFLNRIDTTRTSAESIHNLAVSSYNGQDTWTPYLCMISYTPKRIDSGVLSLFGTQASYYGSPHPETVYSALNYDLVTGTTLSLGDILSEGEFIEVLLQYTLEALAEQEKSSYLYSDYAQTVTAYFSQSSLQHSWYLTPTGLCFYFAPYEIAPYASGVVTAEIPYEKLPGILKDAYFPAERDLASGTIAVSLFQETNLESYSRFSELVLNQGGDQILLHTDQMVRNLLIETGTWSSSGAFFTAQHTVFAASALVAGDAIMVEAALAQTPVLRLQCETDDTCFGMYIVKGEDGTVSLIGE